MFLGRGPVNDSFVVVVFVVSRVRILVAFSVYVGGDGWRGRRGALLLVRVAKVAFLQGLCGFGCPCLLVGWRSLHVCFPSGVS